MKKIFLLVLVLSLILTIPVFASETASLPAFSVTLNGTEVESSFRQFPLLVYKDITYFPMTYYDCRFLGLNTVWDSETNTLTIEKNNIFHGGAYRGYKWEWENGKEHTVSVCNFNIVVNGKVIDNTSEEYPLLTFRDVTYFPLTWRFAKEEFDWNYSFDSEKGLCITSDNVKTKKLNLPGISENPGMVGTDGVYYYYRSGKNIMRVLREDTSSPEIIHTQPDNYVGDGNGTYTTFLYDKGNLYMSYHIGNASMGTTYWYKINPDGSLQKEYPSGYNSGGFGYGEYTVTEGNISASLGHGGGQFGFLYSIDGTEKQVLSDSITFGKRDENGYVVQPKPQIVGKNIYVYGVEDGKDGIYRFDTVTGELKKVASASGNFVAFSGWDNLGLNGMTDMLIYVRDKKLYRLSVENGAEVMMYSANDADALISGFGGNTIFLAVENEGKTKVYRYDSHGLGSFSGCMMETALPANVIINDAGMIVDIYESGEYNPDEDIRLFAASGLLSIYISSDSTYGSGFIYENTLIYVTDGSIVTEVCMTPDLYNGN